MLYTKLFTYYKITLLIARISINEQEFTPKPNPNNTESIGSPYFFHKKIKDTSFAPRPVHKVHIVPRGPKRPQ